MGESERIERLKENRYLEPHESDKIDEVFGARIKALLNHPQISAAHSDRGKMRRMFC
jgi:hypothetical protein